MISVTKTLLKKLKLKANDAEAELITIARREAAGKIANDDVAKLEEALRLTGKGVEQYQEMIALLQRAKGLKVEAAKLPAASAAYVKAREAILVYQTETRELEKARREGQLELELARNVEYSKFDKANKAQCAIERLKCAHPELFDGKAVDLDSVTLTSG